MRKLVKVLTGVGIIAAVVIVGVAVGWFGAGRVGPKPSNPANVSSPSSVNPPAEKIADPVRPKATDQAKTRKGPAAPDSTTPAVAPVTPPAVTDVITNWDEKLETILGSDGSETEKAKQMVALFPHLPEDGKVEVVQHLSNLLEDKDYAPMGEWLKDAATPEEVLDALMADVLNRPNGTKLPLLLDIAKNPQHPKAEEAKDLLELYLEEDYGKDWSKWQAKTEEWIKQNPD